MHLKTVEKSENEHWKTKIQFFLDTKNNDGQSEIRIKSYEQILQSLELFLLFITMFSTILLPSKSIPNHAAPLRSTPCTMQLILVLLPNMPSSSFHFSPALITPLIPTRRRRRPLWSTMQLIHILILCYPLLLPSIFPQPLSLP